MALKNGNGRSIHKYSDYSSKSPSRRSIVLSLLAIALLPTAALMWYSQKYTAEPCAAYTYSTSSVQPTNQNHETSSDSWHSMASQQHPLSPEWLPGYYRDVPQTSPEQDQSQVQYIDKPLPNSAATTKKPKPSEDSKDSKPANISDSLALQSAGFKLVHAMIKPQVKSSGVCFFAVLPYSIYGLRQFILRMAVEDTMVTYPYGPVKKAYDNQRSQLITTITREYWKAYQAKSQCNRGDTLSAFPDVFKLALLGGVVGLQQVQGSNGWTRPYHMYPNHSIVKNGKLPQELVNLCNIGTMLLPEAKQPLLDKLQDALEIPKLKATLNHFPQDARERLNADISAGFSACREVMQQGGGGVLPISVAQDALGAYVRATMQYLIHAQQLHLVPVMPQEDYDRVQSIYSTDNLSMRTFERGDEDDDKDTSGKLRRILKAAMELDQYESDRVARQLADDGDEWDFELYNKYQMTSSSIFQLKQEYIRADEMEWNEKMMNVLSLQSLPQDQAYRQDLRWGQDQGVVEQRRLLLDEQNAKPASKVTVQATNTQASTAQTGGDGKQKAESNFKATSNGQDSQPKPESNQQQQQQQQQKQQEQQNSAVQSSDNQDEVEDTQELPPVPGVQTDGPLLLPQLTDGQRTLYLLPGSVVATFASLPLPVQHRVTRVFDLGFRLLIGDMQSYLEGLHEGTHLSERVQLPEIIHLGPQKSGSTSMYFCVNYSGLFGGTYACNDGLCAEDPSVQYRVTDAGQVKEWHVYNAVFADKVSDAWDKFYSEGVSAANVTNLEGHPMSMDLSPAYLKGIHTAVWSYLLAPDPSRMRFIISLREPSDRLVSEIGMLMHAWDKNLNLTTIINRELDQFEKCASQTLYACWNVIQGTQFEGGTPLFCSNKGTPSVGEAEYLLNEYVRDPVKLLDIPFIAFQEVYVRCNAGHIFEGMYGMHIRMWWQLYKKDQFVISPQSMLSTMTQTEYLVYLSHVSGYYLSEETIKASMMLERKQKNMTDEEIKSDAVLSSLQQKMKMCKMKHVNGYSGDFDREPHQAALDRSMEFYEGHGEILEKLIPGYAY